MAQYEIIGDWIRKTNEKSSIGMEAIRISMIASIFIMDNNTIGSEKWDYTISLRGANTTVSFGYKKHQEDEYRIALKTFEEVLGIKS